MPLTFKISVLAIHIVEFLFFAGIIGCATAVVFSWISIVKDVVTRDS